MLPIPLFPVDEIRGVTSNREADSSQRLTFSQCRSRHVLPVYQIRARLGSQWNFQTELEIHTEGLIGSRSTIVNLLHCALLGLDGRSKPLSRVVPVSSSSQLLVFSFLVVDSLSSPGHPGSFHQNRSRYRSISSADRTCDYFLNPVLLCVD